MDDTQTDLRARRGDLIVFATGEYSDYGYEGHFVALEDITQAHFDAAKVDAEAKVEAEERWSFDVHSLFIAALIRAGLLVSVTVTEFHIGAYGELDLP